MVAPTPFFADRGTHIRILEEALALERLGHQVTIVTYHIGGMPQLPAGSRIRIRRIHRWLFWYDKLEAGPDWQKVLLDILLMRKAWWITLRERPDVLHGHLHEGALIVWGIGALVWWRPLVVLADLHGSLTGEMVSHSYLKTRFLYRAFRLVERFVHRLPLQFVTSSWANAEVVARDRGSEIPVLLDGVDVVRYTLTAADQSTLRTKYALPQDVPIVVYTGALMPNKGVGLILEALPAILAAHSGLHVVLAGAPRSWIDSELAKLDPEIIRNHVTVVHPLPYHTLHELLQVADIAIDPKVSGSGEASGKMLQYMGAGLPVAAFETVNNRKYLGEHVRLAEKTSGADLSELVLWYLANPVEAAAAGLRNQTYAREFSWDVSAAKLSQIYQSALPTQS